MTEAQARKLCTDRHRNPDRDMTGPNGPLKAWETYDTDMRSVVRRTANRYGLHPTDEQIDAYVAERKAGYEWVDVGNGDYKLIDVRTARLNLSKAQTHTTETRPTQRHRMTTVEW